MEKIIIEIPEKLGNTYESYDFFIILTKRLKIIESSTIILDFKKTRWFRANLTAVLGAICSYSLRINKNKIVFKNLNDSIRKIFKKNHFSKKLKLDIINDTYNTTIKYKEFKSKEKNNFQEYLRYEMVPSLKVKMSNEFEREFRRAIEELFQNSRLHGNCDKIYTCGQHFPSEDKVYFTIVNLGTTIKENVVRKLDSHDITASESINWATKNGNTTKADDQAGGLGLPFLIDFLSKNHGFIQIISSNGFYEKSDEKITPLLFESEFPGTIVNLVFKIHDNKFYKTNFEEQYGIIAENDLIENIF